MFPPPFIHDPPSEEQEQNASIRETDSDAAIARYSAVQKGYLQDPFIRYLVPKAHLQPPRPPLINIGTYVRSAAIDQLIEQWMLLSKQESVRCQIVSFGAGSDTRFWRIATGPHRDQLASYIELDFVENTTKKAMAIRKNKALSSHLRDVELAGGGSTLHSQTYHLLPIDLRVPPSESIASLLASPTDPILNTTLPTLLLFECVLVYISPESSRALIQWFVSHFSSPSSGVLAGLVYEMFGLGDSFGKVMLNNLKSRNISLPGATPYQTYASLPTRFMQHEFTTAHALTLREIRRSYISKSELSRIATLEMLDEIEELDLVLEHYAVTWGVKIPNENGNASWKVWGLKRPELSSTADDRD